MDNPTEIAILFNETEEEVHPQHYIIVYEQDGLYYGIISNKDLKIDHALLQTGVQALAHVSSRFAAKGSATHRGIVSQLVGMSSILEGD